MRDVLARILCSIFGHPPVARRFFGYVYCGRCGAPVGDTLMGAFDLKQVALLDCSAGRDCSHCPRIFAGLRLRDKLLTRRAA